MRNKNRTKIIAGTGLLLAIEIIFQIIGNYVQLGPVSINLSLIPITIGAIFYGPIMGGFIGLFSGFIVLFSPSTMNMFFTVSPIGTILVCLLKTTFAGVICGIVSRLLKKFGSYSSSLIASILVPIVNTGLFIVGALIFYQPILVAEGYSTAIEVLIFVWIGWNFIFEFLISLLLTPVIAKITQHFAQLSDLN